MGKRTSLDRTTHMAATGGHPLLALSDDPACQCGRGKHGLSFRLAWIAECLTIADTFRISIICYFYVQFYCTPESAFPLPRTLAMSETRDPAWLVPVDGLPQFPGTSVPRTLFPQRHAPPHVVRIVHTRHTRHGVVHDVHTGAVHVVHRRPGPRCGTTHSRRWGTAPCSCPSSSCGRRHTRAPLPPILSP